MLHFGLLKLLMDLYPLPVSVYKYVCRVAAKFFQKRVCMYRPSISHYLPPFFPSMIVYDASVGAGNANDCLHFMLGFESSIPKHRACGWATCESNFFPTYTHTHTYAYPMGTSYLLRKYQLKASSCTFGGNGLGISDIPCLATGCRRYTAAQMF